MTRDPRDLLAEALWREPGIVFMRKPWAMWDKLAPDETERVRMRADHLLRILESLGVRLECAATGEHFAQRPASPVIWRYSLSGAATERLVRKAPADKWQIVMIDGAQERVEHTFTLAEAHEHAGMVLMGDPSAKAIPNLGKELSASLEIYRVDAVNMDAQP
jgi:hypothetical protein